MQPLSGNQRPDRITSLMNMSCVLRLPRKMHLCRSSSDVPRLLSSLEMLQNPHVLLTFEEVHNPLRLPRETTSEPPKVVQTPSVLYILTSKCASRHNGVVHFFDISTSKSGPNLVCFVHFDFEKCFAPQRRALFRHLSFQKGPKPVCFVHFDVEMCFPPQRRAIFHLSSGQLASHPPLYWKNTVFRDFATFSRTWIFFLLTSDSSLSSSLPISAFNLSILSEV